MHLEPKAALPLAVTAVVAMAAFALLSGVPVPDDLADLASAVAPASSISCDKVEQSGIRFLGAPLGTVRQHQEMTQKFEVSFDDDQVKATGMAASADLDRCDVPKPTCDFDGWRDHDAGSNAYKAAMKFEGEGDIEYRAYALLNDGTLHVSEERTLHVDHHINWSGSLDPCIYQ